MKSHSEAAPFLLNPSETWGRRVKMPRLTYRKLLIQEAALVGGSRDILSEAMASIYSRHIGNSRVGRFRAMAAM